MTSTANRQRKVTMPVNIRKKFAAAICMLLIAAIMMISSTYAWFTLSTAPEVTGITTNVGANGNLEIALLTEDSFRSGADDLGITTSVGDSMDTSGKDVTESNITWGNLVDLSDLSYGLDQIILNPAALNIIPVDNTLADKLTGCIIQGGLASPLLAPSYGADGRVISVQTATTAGVYDGAKFEESTTGAGVRAIGVSSGITVRVQAYRAALAAITVYMSSAKSAAQASLVDNGQALASLLVTAVANDQYALTAADVTAINAVKTQLTASNDAIANAIRQAALAKYLSASGTGDLSDAQVEEKKAAFAASTLANLATLADGVDISFLNTVIAKHDTVQSNIDGVSVAEGDTYSSITGQIAKLIDRDYVQINGLDGGTLSSEDFSDLASAIIGAGKVELTMLDDSGIYADIASMVGNFTASGLKITVTYNSISINDMPTVMNTAVTGTSMLTTASASAAGGDPVAAGGSTSIDDTYGYMIDLGVRTNAAGSTLLLQQDAKQRIYSDSTAALTQGGGSYLEFKTANRYEFTKDDVTALMSAIRVVFLTPNDTSDGYEILAVAAPNLKYAINNETGLPTVSVADDRFEDTVSFEDSASDNSTTVKAPLYLFDLAAVTVTEIVADNEYITTLGTIKTKEGTENEADFSIIELEQNKAKKISALVYLDGDIVDNTMVKNAATSMTGKVNFQFASSAELIPMDNKAVRENGTEEGGTTAAALTVTKEQLSTAITTIKANEIYTEAAAAADPTAAQTALLSAVTSAESVAADDEAEDAAINSAAATLAAAYIAAGGTNPF